MIDQNEMIRRLEEMSNGCMTMASGAKTELDLKVMESAASAYDHAIDIVRGTDRSGPAYEKAKSDFDELVRQIQKRDGDAGA